MHITRAEAMQCAQVVSLLWARRFLEAQRAAYRFKARTTSVALYRLMRTLYFIAYNGQRNGRAYYTHAEYIHALGAWSDASSAMLFKLAVLSCACGKPSALPAVLLPTKHQHRAAMAQWWTEMRDCMSVEEHTIVAPRMNEFFSSVEDLR